MLSTGTGLAPFISMLWDPRTWEQYENLIVVHSVRYPNELAYAETIEAFRGHELFAPMAHKLHYVQAVTRAAVPGALAGRIPAAIADRSLEERVGQRLDHDRSRILICGNPEMVDDTRKLLASRGYTTSRRGAPGHLAVENYW
jgi:ferredoxin--NADP+ reductase